VNTERTLHIHDEEKTVVHLGMFNVVVCVHCMCCKMSASLLPVRELHGSACSICRLTARFVAGLASTMCDCGTLTHIFVHIFVEI